MHGNVVPVTVGISLTGVLSADGDELVPLDKGPYALTPNTIEQLELIFFLGSLLPRGGPVQDSVLTGPVTSGISSSVVHFELGSCGNAVLAPLMIHSKSRLPSALTFGGLAFFGPVLDPVLTAQGKRQK